MLVPWSAEAIVEVPTKIRMMGRLQHVTVGFESPHRAESRKNPKNVKVETKVVEIALQSKHWQWFGKGTSCDLVQACPNSSTTEHSSLREARKDFFKKKNQQLRSDRQPKI